MSQMKHILKADLYKLKCQLMKFANITEQDIQKIWRCSNETHIDDLSKLVYDYSSPLFHKMIFRFRQGEQKPSRLFKGCDPCNQRKLMSFFGLDNRTQMEIMEFFGWITNSLGIYDIAEYDEDWKKKDNIIIFSNKRDSELVKLWLESSEVHFFFAISSDIQDKLIARFNIESVDRYNAMMAKLENEEF